LPSKSVPLQLGETVPLGNCPKDVDINPKKKNKLSKKFFILNEVLVSEQNLILNKGTI
jgi:hypothetical protein